jgi:DNA excision repair protein ERCC-2
VQIDHERRSATFALGELASFTPGPRPPEAGPSGRWRAELGARWHREKRSTLEAATATADVGASAPRFEVAIRGALAHRGWLFHLEGRIDQSLPAANGTHLRELKTTLHPLPRPAEELRSSHPEHFRQLGLYLALSELAEPGRCFTGELVYIEAATGLEQSVSYSEADRAALAGHLDVVADFLEQRRAALLRLRTLRWTPAFAAPRPGQETIVTDLVAALGAGAPVVLAAPTGFGKTGVLLEAAFSFLRDGHADRIVYLTGKSTGQLHVLTTLQKMLAPSKARPPEPIVNQWLTTGLGSGGRGKSGVAGNSVGAADRTGAEAAAVTTETTRAAGAAAESGLDATTGLVAWNLRSKREHCVNDIFHCSRARCGFLHDLPRRWREAGLARFHLFPEEARDLPALRAAGQAAGVCPYEIARAALPGCEVWLGDFNYLFSPSNRGVFVEQPTWDLSLIHI